MYRCPATGCERMISKSFVFCGKHYAEISSSLRQDILCSNDESVIELIILAVKEIDSHANQKIN